MPTMTGNQGEVLANLINKLRPDWGVSGVAKALYDARDQGDAFNLSVAAIRAAADPANRTPGVIGLNGAHWQGLMHLTPKVEAAALCGVCSRPQELCERVRFADDDHAFEARA